MWRLWVQEAEEQPAWFPSAQGRPQGSNLWGFPAHSQLLYPDPQGTSRGSGPEGKVSTQLVPHPLPRFPIISLLLLPLLLWASWLLLPGPGVPLGGVRPP